MSQQLEERVHLVGLAPCSAAASLDSHVALPVRRQAPVHSQLYE